MSLSVQHGLQLQPFNTFGIRATARLAGTLYDTAAVDELLATLQAQGHARPRIIGGGSNLLLARDLDEPVLFMRTRGKKIIDQQADNVWIDVAAGEPWHDTVRWSLAQGYSGLENLALIPGRVGAAPWQNIGAYGVEAGERIHSVDAIHLDSGQRRRFLAAECAFGYRQSFFKTAAGQAWLILGVRLQLSRHFTPRLAYAGLEQALAAVPSPSPLQVAEAVESIRRRKLPDPRILGNAGSFFHNPVVNGKMLERLRQQDSDLPWHATAPQSPPNQSTGIAAEHAGPLFKLSAGWLIDACGWKGHREGDAGVSPHHALVLVNYGNARGQDILHLARRIQSSVYERFGIHLQPEPIIID
ncbi:MAG: UDP-N-acetylmuramate dehydrogenase [Lautropia sp.]|nr:UDP-N-acetylmuramate dehydrogenase [Lautropia sp.]